jgi:superfamily II DNA or RNA helicase
VPDFAPGSRVLIRDEEWVVRDVAPCDQGGHQLECIGLSETVMNREGVFLSVLDKVTVLDPAKTELVADDTAEFLASRLYVEAKLRLTVPVTTAISLGNRGAMDALPFQLEPTHRVLQQLRPRFLIADAVGLGKTLEAGILVSELMRRGKARRILVVTTKSMMLQFQKEFWTRFSIPLTRLDSAGVQRIRRELPANHNPFHYHDKTIISVDTLKRDTEYRHYLEKAHWDVIVIDEAHNVSFKGNRTLANKLASLLATRSDALILLTATPHSGDRESFASLMRMLDATALPRQADYGPDDVKHLFLRRFKKDVREQIRADFPDREVYQFPAVPTQAEEAAFEALANLNLHIDAASRGGAEMLFRTTLEKSLLSSPAACIQTLRERMRRLSAKDATHPDIEPLAALLTAVEAIAPDDVSKLGELVRRLQQDPVWQWSATNAGDRLVIFTERIETLKFLQRELPPRLGLSERQVEILHGQRSDEDLQQVVERFGQANSPLRLLIASDVASEGLNLHFQSHRLVHFDVPWSLMVFQQRNGRIDRYGQAQAPLIAYLTTDTRNTRIRGDVRILEILIEKDEQAARNIGDPSIFMGLYDAEQETRRVAQAMEQCQSPATFAATLADPDQALDWLDALMAGATPESAQPGPAVQINTTPAIFENDFAYVKAGLDCLRQRGDLERGPQLSDPHLTVQFQPEGELADVLQHQLSPEMRPEDNVYSLTADRQAILRDIQAARESDRWPHQQLLWPLHPVLQWLDLKMVSLFGRQRAPVIRVPRGVAADEALVLIAALIPNRRGQPVLNDWFAVRIGLDGQVKDHLDLTTLKTQTGFGQVDLPNAAVPFDATRLQLVLRPALDHARQVMDRQYRAFNSEAGARAQQELARLDRLREQHQQQLNLTFREGEDALAHLRVARREAEAREINERFQALRKWVSDTLELDARAQLSVVAVFLASATGA